MINRPKHAVKFFSSADERDAQYSKLLELSKRACELSHEMSELSQQIENKELDKRQPISLFSDKERYNRLNDEYTSLSKEKRELLEAFSSDSSNEKVQAKPGASFRKS